MMRGVMLLSVLFCSGPLAGVCAEGDVPVFLDFVRARAAEMRAGDVAPGTVREWEAEKGSLRVEMEAAWGGFVDGKCALEPRVVGVLEREGYRIEKVVFQTMPEVWMTANAYVPEGGGKRAAVLCVHGHWRGAKQDPAVQARCIGLAKLGYFVLVVDASGAGERGVGKALGEYHGEMVAATLMPTGKVLCGLQVYENMRAIDYLQSRPEVDGERIGVTGASGGGNQTMYLAAWDERVKAAVPTCSVGNYQAYLGAACCLCEVVPGALGFMEESAVLSMVAPRALMVSSATQDSVQFSVEEAAKSIAGARPVYALYGVGGKLKHAVFESKHDYNREMREAMYGWMALHLRGEGDGSPVAEPEVVTEDPEVLRCFPGESRPEGWLTLPEWAAREGRALLQRGEGGGRGALERSLGVEGYVRGERVGGGGDFVVEVEKGLPVRVLRQAGTVGKVVLVLDFGGCEAALGSGIGAGLRKAGATVCGLDLRGTGGTAIARDKIGRAPDHNTAEWSLWLGRPLLGQWVTDVRRVLDALGEDGVVVVGLGAAGTVATFVGALDERVSAVVSVGALGSYLSEVAYVGQRLGLMVPGLLAEVGDLGVVAGLVSPRPLLVAGAVAGGGGLLPVETMRELGWRGAGLELRGEAVDADVVGWVMGLPGVVE